VHGLTVASAEPLGGLAEQSITTVKHP
jgi:hypothetical protein